MLSQNLRDVVPRKAPRGGLFGTFVVLASFFEPVLAAFFATWPSPLLLESLTFRQGCPSGAQWRPKWLQGCLKAAKMELKCRPRSSKCGSKTSRKKEKQQRKRKWKRTRKRKKQKKTKRTWNCQQEYRHTILSISRWGAFPLRYIYIYIYLNIIYWVWMYCIFIYIQI